MKPIKFRAWHFAEKKMLEVDELNHIASWCFDGMLGVNGINKTIGIQGGKHNDCVVMQSTGLKEKNGKEIYEGDILNYCNKKPHYIVRYGNYNRNSGYKNLAPHYIGAAFYLELIDNERPEFSHETTPIYTHNNCAFLYPVTPTFSDFEKYKKNWGLAIIGNIHENPELINE